MLWVVTLDPKESIEKGYTQSGMIHCYRCQLKAIGLLYCETCDCFLCDKCWEEVHNFYPLKLHVQFNKNTGQLV